MGFLVKKARQQITKRLARLITFIEQWFLGPNFNCGFSNSLIVLRVSKDDDDSSDFLKNIIKTNTYENIVILSGRIDHPKIPLSLLLSPKDLGQVRSMISLVRNLNPGLLVLDHLSAMPTASLELMEVFKWLRCEYRGPVVILEHEYTLGQKNSALLGRMMNT